MFLRKPESFTLLFQLLLAGKHICYCFSELLRSSDLHERHMAAVVTSLLQTSTSWYARPHHLPLTCKLAIPPFSADRREPGIIWHWKASLPLVRASPIKSNTTELEQNAEEREALVSALGSDDGQECMTEQENDESNAIRKVGERAEASIEKNNVDSTQMETKEDIGLAQSIEAEGNLGDTALKGSIVAGLLILGAVGGFGVATYIYREQINAFLLGFSDFIEGHGVAGYALFVAVYAGLEVLAIPAIPLTMSAGLLFGNITGTVIVSVSGTIAATIAFLIARYLARERILKLAKGNKKFLAIDKAIGENGFRVVALLRLSPLLPFSLGNYLYGLTSVKLAPYVLGSWLGMLPGSWAYVSAGAVGRAIIQQEAEDPLGGGPKQLVTLGIGILVTVIAATYVTRLAKDAVKEIE